MAAVLRADFPAFIERTFETLNPGRTLVLNWHIEAMAFQLGRVAAGETTRLIINVPPRHLKSICTSVALIAWMMGHDPSRRVICVGYSQDLARKHAQDFRRVVESRWYRALFPGFRLDPRQNTATETATTAGGFRLATSIDGTLTGRGGDLIVLDDPQNANDMDSQAYRERCKEWYDGVLSSRLDDPRTSAIVLVMQRLHMDDLVAHVEERGDWERLVIPAIAESNETYPLGERQVHRRRKGGVIDPTRQSPAELERQRHEMRAYYFAAQYQQHPVPREGSLVQWDWFKTIPAPLPASAYCATVFSIDPASGASSSGDYSVCLVFGVTREPAPRYHLLNVVRGRFGYPALRHRLCQEAKQRPNPVFLVEKSSSGGALIGDLSQRVRPARVIPVMAVRDKTYRFEIASAKIEDGLIFVPQEARWLEEFRSELLAFPQGRFDDQADALSQFLLWVDHPRVARFLGRDRTQRPNPVRPHGSPRPRIVSGGSSAWDVIDAIRNDRYRLF